MSFKGWRWLSKMLMGIASFPWKVKWPLMTNSPRFHKTSTSSSIWRRCSGWHSLSQNCCPPLLSNLECNFLQMVGDLPNTMLTSSHWWCPHKASSLLPIYNVSQVNIGHGPFVLAIVDLDVLTPQNPNVSQIRHFLGGNFFIWKQHGLLINTTPAITEFTGSYPANTLDPHWWALFSCLPRILSFWSISRYILLLFKQPPWFNKQQEIIPEMDCRYFNISQSAEKVGFGNPLGGTFFYAVPHTWAPWHVTSLCYQYLFEFSCAL